MILTRFFDNEYREVGILRQYSRKVTSKNNRTIEVIYTEIYTDKDVRYFIKEGSYKTKPDESKELNPRPHVIAIREGDGEILARDYGRYPILPIGQQPDRDIRFSAYQGLN